MSREIKFRAWNKDHKIMCYANEDDEAGYWDGVLANNVEIVNAQLQRKTTCYIWMQYTGLKDKNSVEIYEDDVLINIYTKEKCRVVYSYACFMPFHKSKNAASDYKVIGNIYENPELLEQ